MEFAKSRSGVIRSVSQRWLYKHWSRLRAQAPMPCWKDLPVDEIGQQIDTLMFCDVAGTRDAPRFQIRYLGRRLQEAYGGERTGEFLDDVLPPVWREGAMKTYQKTIEGWPVYNIVETRDRSGCDVLLERLILPFTTSAGVNRIVSSIETISAEGKFEQTGLSESPFVGSNCLINAVIEAD